MYQNNVCYYTVKGNKNIKEKKKKCRFSEYIQLVYNGLYAYYYPPIDIFKRNVASHYSQPFGPVWTAKNVFWFSNFSGIFVILLNIYITDFRSD
jgi:hypothetical protein